MALMNPPALRPSGIVTIVRYLDSLRGQNESEDRLVATLAPPTLKGDAATDVTANLRVAIELGLVQRSGDRVGLPKRIPAALGGRDSPLLEELRKKVFDETLNSAPWRSQVGARDLTNALSWFLTFSAAEAPTTMEGSNRSVEALQGRDFGPRQDEGESSNWPINNASRWIPFRRWACTLGFAWVNPQGHVVPDPSPAIRDVLPVVFGGNKELAAHEFVDGVARRIPVLDGGRYREFVIANWQRPAAPTQQLTGPLSDALDRLQAEGIIRLDDRADAARVAKAGGATFSHVRYGAIR